MWDDDAGWGVIDSPDAPGGCWAHFSEVEMPGFRSLKPGQHVQFTVQAVRQDGFDFAAVSIVPGEASRRPPAAASQ